MRKPDDTRKVQPIDRLVKTGFLGGPARSAEDMIVSEERAGGEQMLNATVVPTEGSEALVVLGFELGDVVADDPIFREVTAPEGWARKSGEHHYGYWTYIVDEHGYDRVAMFYKAAFYDRNAHCSVVTEPARDCPACFGKGLENQDARPGIVLGSRGEMPCPTCGGTGREFKCAIGDCPEPATQVHGIPPRLTRTCDGHAEEVMLRLAKSIAE